MVKVQKKIEGETTAFFLRCLWHIIEEKECDQYLHWHPERNDAFVIHDIDCLDQFFKTYKDVTTNWNSFRRSLYFYGFSQRKNVWSHAALDKTDKTSLRLIKRKRTPNPEEKIRRRFAKMIRQNPMMMSMGLGNPFGLPASLPGLPPQGPPQHAGFPGLGGMPNLQSPTPPNFFAKQEGVPQGYPRPMYRKNTPNIVHMNGRNVVVPDVETAEMQTPYEMPTVKSENFTLPNAPEMRRSPQMEQSGF